MPTLSVARTDQVAAVYRHSHALWGAGLALRDYEGMWEDQRRTAWGERWVRFLVWHDGDRVLSSLKLYRPEIRVGSRRWRAWGIGAIFTPPDERGRGHATRMIERVLAQADEEGDAPVLLFSDIGTSYYERFGFRSLPSDEAVGSLPASAPDVSDGPVLRPMRPSDIEDVAEAHAAWCEGRPLAILRDRAQWAFLVERSRTFFERLDGSTLDRRFRVATWNGKIVGYTIAFASERDWNFREVGSIEADPALAAAVMRAAAVEARAGGCRTVYGWIPRSWAALVPEWRLRRVRRRRAVAMIRTTSDEVAGLDREGAFIPYMDQF